MENRIDRALERCGRKRSEINLVAVTKKFSAARIAEAYQAGLREFGENYVQEFAAKKQELGSLHEARFHLIGHLQSNKAQAACELFDVVETADSARILERLDRAAGERGQNLEVLLEVKLSDEAAKTGTAAGKIGELLSVARKCSHITVTGLMTVPPWSEDPERSRPYFRELSRLSREHNLAKLSMGMSGDFEVAIEEGATIVRIGTALFGPRPKPAEEIVAPLRT
ncbi:MAG TPA: YggS family pyridoxal phosphate-dependent enzyme [Bryobacteraceae bacterium]|nr:YggS family pyridoxal phosphate-dependent enzyme [Bryobacteraceae bacterium]